MRLGVHEVQELHEVLNEKINMIDHHALYISEARDPQLKSLLERHQQYLVQGYQQALGFMQGRGVNVSPYHVRNVGTPTYGAQGGGQTMRPHPGQQRLSDQSISAGALSQHKCGAARATTAALEAADPELRLMFSNDILTCVNMAYEMFQYMNQRGYYQVSSADSQFIQDIAGNFSTPGTQTGISGQYGTTPQAFSRPFGVTHA